MKRLKFEKAKCIGCQLCAQICSAKKEGVICPTEARIGIETSYDDGKLVYHDNYCILCGICEKNCPTGAIKMGEYIEVDPALCTACGICVEKCPKHVVKIRKEVAVICDTCKGDPNCVKVCPQHALTFE